jgi:hypothetical protein
MDERDRPDQQSIEKPQRRMMSFAARDDRNDEGHDEPKAYPPHANLPLRSSAAPNLAGCASDASPHLVGLSRRARLTMRK